MFAPGIDLSSKRVLLLEYLRENMCELRPYESISRFAFTPPERHNDQKLRRYFQVAAILEGPHQDSQLPTLQYCRSLSKKVLANNLPVSSSLARNTL